MTRPLPLFVYGTLCSGEDQATLLGASPRRKAFVKGELYLLPAGYPALVLGGPDPVHGELVELQDERLFRLVDQYEGVDEGLFARVQCDVRMGLRTERAWVYTLDAGRARTGLRLRDGRYRSVRRR
jgi:gamma-glutamylcyclotransferase (GGCT)/AIG2-like uncharacterized protein YtfP